MGLLSAARDAWERLAHVEAASERKTTTLAGPLYAPVRVTNALPKPTAANLRRFAETPAARRAINCIKNKIACMNWRIQPRAGIGVPAPDAAERAAAITRAFHAPNSSDSFMSFLEQVLEDVLVGGFGAAEMESTGDPQQPVRLYPVDGATIAINAAWNGEPDAPRFEQVRGRERTELRDDELMYIRLNPRTHTVFGLGKVEVAFESISHFLAAHRYAGKLAANNVAGFALWMSDRTPEQQERLVRWWQQEVEGSGHVPVLSTEQKPEVLRFAGGTDADLHLEWQQFLLSMIANAFDLPAMMLGVTGDVNRSTATEMADEAFQNAIVPLARLLAEHLTRDVIGKRLGWSDLEFTWNDLDSRDETSEADIQVKLLNAGVLTVDEVRAMRGLGKAA